MKLRRGSDYTFVINASGINMNNIEKVVVYVKDSYQTVVKTGKDLIIDDGKIYAKLSQKETMGFKCRYVFVQARFKTVSGNSIPTSICKVPTAELLKEEEI